MANLATLLTARYWQYPQTWYFMPRWRPLRRLLQIVHGWLGHEISKTEWGYGGGEFVDGNCRWCDAHIDVPYDKAHFYFPQCRAYIPLLGQKRQPLSENDVQT